MRTKLNFNLFRKNWFHHMKVRFRCQGDHSFGHMTKYDLCNFQKEASATILMYKKLTTALL